MIKDANGKFDNYSISPKIRQILLHWVFLLTQEINIKKKSVEQTRKLAKNKIWIF